MTKRIQIGRICFMVLSILFGFSILAQIFLAGLAIFVNPLHWSMHTTFVHFFELLPILMIVMGFVGKLPPMMIWQSAGLVGLLFIMYFTANISPVWPWLAAVHPVIAVLMFIGSIYLSKSVMQLLMKQKETKGRD